MIRSTTRLITRPSPVRATTLLRPSIIATTTIPPVGIRHLARRASPLPPSSSSSSTSRARRAAGLVMIASLMAVTTPSVATTSVATSQQTVASISSTIPTSAASSSSSTQRPLRLFVTGGTGGTGLEIIKQAIEMGHYVTVIARSPEKIELKHQNLEIIKGDPLNGDDVTRAMSSSYDGVLNALGTASISDIFSSGPHVEVTGTEALIKAMKATNNKRLIVCSSNGVADSRKFTPCMYTYIISHATLHTSCEC
jgi:predicted extracellular nuclease